MKRAAIYCRVSTDDQKERDTIENQIEVLKSYIEMNNNEYKLVAEYLDNGISGTTSLDIRPYGSKLLHDASQNEFDTIIVYKIDRFARDTLAALNAIENLNKYNVNIVSISEPFDLNTPIGRFQFITYLNMAELERNNILDRMYLGATRAAKQGRWMGGVPPFGYTVNSNGFLEIDKEQSEIVKLIYNMYLKKENTMIGIAKHLNDSNIKAPYRYSKSSRAFTGIWRQATIRRILSSEVYKGIHHYGKRGTRRKDLIERTTPIIIAATTWDMVQDIKKEKQLNSNRNNTKIEYLLKRLITCDICGRKFYGESYNSNKSAAYICAGKRGDHKILLNDRCTNNNLNVKETDKIIWDKCIEFMNLYINNSIDFNITEYNNIIDTGKLELELQSLNKEKNNLIRMCSKELITESELEKELKEIRKNQAYVLEKIEQENNKIKNIELEKSKINSILNKIEHYKNRMDNLNFEEKRDLVNLIIKEITVTNSSGFIDIQVKYFVSFKILTDMDLMPQQT